MSFLIELQYTAFTAYGKMNQAPKEVPRYTKYQE